MNPIALKSLSALKNGEKGIVVNVDGTQVDFFQRVLALGIVTGNEIEVCQDAPLGDPMTLRAAGAEISLRRRDAEKITLLCE